MPKTKILREDLDEDEDRTTPRSNPPDSIVQNIRAYLEKTINQVVTRSKCIGITVNVKGSRERLDQFSSDMDRLLDQMNLEGFHIDLANLKSHLFPTGAYPELDDGPIFELDDALDFHLIYYICADNCYRY